MLPIVAMLVAGYMAKQQRRRGDGRGRGAASAVCWEACSVDQRRGGDAVAPTAGLGSMLDLNGDGNPARRHLADGRQSSRRRTMNEKAMFTDFWIKESKTTRNVLARGFRRDRSTVPIRNRGRRRRSGGRSSAKSEC